MVQHITMEQAKRVLEIVDAGLVGGLGDPEPGQMCVEAAVCYAFGEKHGDKPKCVDENVAGVKITINDTQWWDSDGERAKGLRKLAILQLGTKYKKGMENFPQLCSDMIIERFKPFIFRKINTDLQTPAVREALKVFMKHADSEKGAEQLEEFIDTFNINDGGGADLLHRLYEDNCDLDDMIQRIDENFGDERRDIIIKAVEDTLIKMKVPGIKFLPLLKIKKKAAKPKVDTFTSTVDASVKALKKPVKKPTKPVKKPTKPVKKPK